MSRARWDTRNGYSSFFANEAIQWNNNLNSKYHGGQDGVEWTPGATYAQVNAFAEGAPGTRRIRVMNGAGGVMDNKKINIGGREFKLDAQGEIRVLDQEFMQEQVNIVQERQAFLNELCKAIIWGGDQMAVSILGAEGFFALAPIANKGDFLRVDHRASANGDKERHAFYQDGGIGGAMSQQMIVADARPSHMRALPSTSQEYCLGLNKLLFILDVLNIAFDHDQVHTTSECASGTSCKGWAPCSSRGGRCGLITLE